MSRKITIWAKESELDNQMISLFLKLKSGKPVLYAVIHSDFLHDEAFGGGAYDKGSVLDRLSNGAVVEFELVEKED